jgi:hypothetical protein
VQHRDFVVIRKDVVTVCLKDPAHPFHAKSMQLRRTQCADAGAAINMDPVCHRPQDLLVPDCWRHFEIAVNDADDCWTGKRGLIELPLPHRRAPFERGIDGP